MDRTAGSQTKEAPKEAPQRARKDSMKL
jgi:hypothetical protein